MYFCAICNNTKKASTSIKTMTVYQSSWECVCMRMRQYWSGKLLYNQSTHANPSPGEHTISSLSVPSFDSFSLSEFTCHLSISLSYQLILQAKCVCLLIYTLEICPHDCLCKILYLLLMICLFHNLHWNARVFIISHRQLKCVWVSLHRSTVCQRADEVITNV